MDRNRSAKNTANKIDAEVIMVRRLFLQRFRQANFKLFIIIVLAYSFHILLGEEIVIDGRVKLYLLNLHNSFLSLFLLRNDLQEGGYQSSIHAFDLLTQFGPNQVPILIIEFRFQKEKVPYLKTLFHQW